MNMSLMWLLLGNNSSVLYVCVLKRDIERERRKREKRRESEREREEK